MQIKFFRFYPQKNIYSNEDPSEILRTSSKWEELEIRKFIVLYVQGVGGGEEVAPHNFPLSAIFIPLFITQLHLPDITEDKAEKLRRKIPISSGLLFSNFPLSYKTPPNP
jgi:hypothetical protein